MFRKYIALLICLLFATTAIFSQSAICSYKYRKRITFDPTKVSGPIDLTNFTALININSDNDLRTVANSGHVESTNGFDIVFTTDDGVTLLDHQLEKYTPTTGEYVAWVRIPNLSTTYNTNIYMYYGKTGATDPSLNTTWSSAYKSVWHLNNNSFADGTSNGNNATNGGSTNLATAKIAGGRTFSGAGGNYIQAPLAGATGGSGNGSVQLWGMVTSYSTSTYFFGETTNQTGYANRVQLYMGDNSGNLYLGMGGNHTQQTNVQLMALNTWYHISLTWATTGAGVGTYSIYVDGVLKNSGNYSAFTAMHTFADIGNDGNASQRTEEIPGRVDEVRVTNSTLSNDWILTEYNNQNSPSTFYAVSAEPAVWDGSNNSNWNTGNNWVSNSVPSAGEDIILPNVSNQPNLNANKQITSLWVRTGTTLTFNNNRTLSVAYDITNCGTIDGSASGEVNLNSSASDVQVQHISGSGTYDLTDFTINNSFSVNPTVMFNKDVNVSRNLTLTSGIVRTSATNILALGTNGSSTSGSAASFVSGPMSKAGNTNFVFPIGKGSKWRRTAISSISSSTTYRAEYFDAAFTNTTPVNAPLNNVSKLEYWQVDRIVGTGNANLSLYWEVASASGITNCPDITIARWNGSSWDERAGTSVGGSSCSGAGAGLVTTNALITAFSPFTFGSKSTGVNPLPVELLEFSSTCNESEIEFNWTTATEKNNAYFEIESSLDGNNWKSIAQITGSGNSKQEVRYSYRYNIVSDEKLYYKLNQVDFDGIKQSFKTVYPNCSGNSVFMTLFPNPSNGQITVLVNSKKQSQLTNIKIIDALGKICFQKEIIFTNRINEFSFDLDLKSGMYSVLLYENNFILDTKKLILKK
jgi:hypothetical protein